MTDEHAPHSSGVEVKLSRDLGLAEVLMIGIGPNIGSSIFLLIGLATQDVGPALLIAFALNFIVTIFTALAYAELASAFPETGGGYLWVKEGLFEPLGFLGGWMSWIGHCIACSVYAIGFGTGVGLLLSQYGITLFCLGPDLVSTIFTTFFALASSSLTYGV
jgi:amino acid transporter